MIGRGRALPWAAPDGWFTALARQTGDLVYLSSSLKTAYSGDRTFLAFNPATRYRGESWEEAAEFLHSAQDGSLPSFGYFSYEMGRSLERYPETEKSPIALPLSQWVRFRSCLEWRHAEHTLILHGEDALPFDRPPVAEAPAPVPRLERLHSAMDRGRYLERVEEALSAIAEGEFYQVNLTRKFEGAFTSIPHGPSLFRRLLAASPAPYSAYLRFGDQEILSSSPELFLRVDAARNLESRPIKGTRRKAPEEADAVGRDQLQRSAKDRAENLMIVDLVRNDLARVCEPGTVQAPHLFEAESFRTLHHLSTNVRGRLTADRRPIDAVKAAFPPGSMTGAPKIAAQRWCAGAERIDRGVYSGALGWIGSSEAELSVVIRTLVLENARFEFQVGGGIVAESTPEKEWQETLVKTRGITRALGLADDYLAMI